MMPNNKLLLDICNVAIQAGNEILNFYNNDIEVTHKEDLSPLTKADLASNKIILESLNNLNSNIPILSEESLVDWSIRKNWKKYWLVDPLDGTKEFIKKNGEFTVNIALIEDNNPILGVVYVPAKSLLYLAEKNKGSFKTNTKNKLENFEGIQKIVVSSQTNRPRVIGSRSHSNATFDNWVKEKFPNADIVQAGSSLKFCLIAEGEADIYPRFGPTSEWDIAAGHMIVNEAGGKIRTFKNDSIKYNTKENIINPEFYAIGNITLN
jgi:3'(2'), 5'-bisphosphate nucleotidase